MFECKTQPHFGTNFAIFVIFFGMSLFNAFISRRWLEASLWLLGATMFLAADFYAAKKNRPRATLER